MTQKISDSKFEMGSRVESLKTAIHNSTPSVCPERALLWTEYFLQAENWEKPKTIQIAEATRHVLRNVSINIYDDEVIVGNYTSKRVGGIIYPELNGVGALKEIDSINITKGKPSN